MKPSPAVTEPTGNSNSPAVTEPTGNNTYVVGVSERNESSLGKTVSTGQPSRAISSSTEEVEGVDTVTPSQSLNLIQLDTPESLHVSSLPVSSLPVSSLPVSSLPVSSLPISSPPVSSLPVRSEDVGESLEPPDGDSTLKLDTADLMTSPDAQETGSVSRETAEQDIPAVGCLSQSQQSTADSVPGESVPIDYELTLHSVSAAGPTNQSGVLDTEDLPAAADNTGSQPVSLSLYLCPVEISAITDSSHSGISC